MDFSNWKQKLDATAKLQKDINRQRLMQEWKMEDLSVEVYNKGTEPIMFRSTRDPERIDCLTIPCDAGDTVLLPHQQYIGDTPSGRVAELQFRFGRSKIKFNRDKDFQK